VGVFVITAAYVKERMPPKFIHQPADARGRAAYDKAVYERFTSAKDEFGDTFMAFFPTSCPSRGSGLSRDHLEVRSFPCVASGLMKLLDEAMGAMRASFAGLWYPSAKRRKGALRILGHRKRFVRKNFAGVLAIVAVTRRRVHGPCDREEQRARRLGSGAGHFFREIWGQTWRASTCSARDHPGFKNGSHAWSCRILKPTNDFSFICCEMAVPRHLDRRSAAGRCAKSWARTVGQEGYGR
jgi:hypothetical protein